MTRIERTVIIDAPVEEVFRYAADYRTWDRWFEGVSDFRPTTHITQGNGARYAYKARLLGVSASVETEIHDFVDSRGWTGTATKGMPHRAFWHFEPAGRSTRFTYALEYRLPVPLVGPLLDALFIKSQWTKVIAGSLDNLRNHFGSLTANTSH